MMSDERIDFASIRSRFTLLDERMYFATQCLGPCPVEMFADLEEYRKTLFLRKRALYTYLDRINELTGLCESLLNAPAGSVALRDSATSAQAAIAAALSPAREKNRILISSIDFHSTRYLWRAQERRGFQVQELTPRDGMAVPVEDYVAAIDDRTAVVEAALVSPRTGALLDVRPVIRAARKHGALVVIDAYQAVGVVPVDVTELDADVVVGGTHKWLCGGDMGLAFMYVRPSLAAKLEPVYPGWVGHAALYTSARPSMAEVFSETFTPDPGARRFQAGFPAMEPIYTARAGLRLALEVGVKRIRARSLELTGRMIARGLERGLPVTTSPSPDARGGILCIDTPKGDAICEALEERGIDVDFRPGAGLRIAPHYCHREDECDRVIDEIVTLDRA